ncbi:MAG TPA: dipeptidase [Candidatus Eisenbergiella merdipullorum]|uniref:Dipeptidase n=1 Tax=Candidatus Eisenbergiella merdipullorum TaxID=2838553 RepID=A0A9D2I446_9FIRM|nr:dipeptidase [Candidatus Eisenbergiella merdipullorum]
MGRLAADMHCDTISALMLMRRRGDYPAEGLARNSLHIDLEKLEKGGYLLQNFALFVALSECSDPFRECSALADLYYEELEKNKDRIRPVYHYADIEKNRAEGKLSALLTVEEGAVCKGRLGNLRLLYRLGVRMLTLTWNFPNELGWPNVRMPENGSGDAPDLTMPDREHGLTETGFAFLEEMERLGMIVDVSHLSDAGFWDVARTARKPFVASHSDARAVCRHVRNLDDDMIRALSEKGGVCGLNFCPSFLEEGKEARGSLAAVAAHAKHIVEVGGEDCLGLGSDFDGIPTNEQLPDASSLPRLADAMRKAGLTERQIDKIFSENVLRVYREILK